jgi:hypothetical protein
LGFNVNFPLSTADEPVPSQFLQTRIHPPPNDLAQIYALAFQSTSPTKMMLPSKVGDGVRPDIIVLGTPNVVMVEGIP